MRDTAAHQYMNTKVHKLYPQVRCPISRSCPIILTCRSLKHGVPPIQLPLYAADALPPAVCFRHCYTPLLCR